MKNATFVILAVTFVWLNGCATQGRLTYLMFEHNFSYETLNSSMEKLKSQYDSSIQEQVSALREIRYITKQVKEPGKREIALRALIFLLFPVRTVIYETKVSPACKQFLSHRNGRLT